jgi:hypothetical protein
MSSSTFDPKGKSFQQRLDAFLADVKSTHSLTIRKDSGRTAEWQQRLHICHMFLYNKYNSTKPAKTEGTSRTIDWKHLSDPAVRWSTVQATDLLRTKTNGLPQKEGTKWKAGFEPDKDATRKRAEQLLKEAKVGNSGQAMVSAGLKPCADPCKCGAGRSKHLDDAAADLNTTDMTLLKGKLKSGETIDTYLKKFGLNRPLVNHATSPEPWHVEATTP